MKNIKKNNDKNKDKNNNTINIKDNYNNDKNDNNDKDDNNNKKKKILKSKKINKKKNKKNFIISFKLDKELFLRLSNIEDKSNFIRLAVLKELENICPLCNGTGVLNENQKKHIEKLLLNHEIIKCPDCGEIYIKCKK